MHRLFFFMAALTLAGCMDVEADFDLTEETSSLAMRMSHQLIQMSDDDFKGDCEKDGGAYTVGKEYASCTYERPISVSDWIDQGFASMRAGGSGENNATLDSSHMVAVEDAGWGKVKLTLDVTALLDDIKKDSNNEDIPEDMMDMALAAMAGHGFNFTFKGKAVSETNGEVSDDKRSVSFFVPLTDVIDPGNRVSPDSYSAIIKY